MLKVEEGMLNFMHTKVEGSTKNIVFVHGMDSALDTFADCAKRMEKRGYNTLRIDNPGNGYSPLGDASEYTLKGIAKKIHNTVNNVLGEDTKFVLVGHSLGGLIVIRYAADFPENILVLVAEDIDCRRERGYDKALEKARANMDALKAFDRKFSSKAECKESLMKYEYDEKRIDGYFGKRIHENEDGSVWSGINPYTNYLGMAQVLCTTDGLDSWKDLTAVSQKVSLPVWMFVADPNVWTCCQRDGEGGRDDMATINPAAKWIDFPGAHHSVHSAVSDTFETKLVEAIESAAKL
jgi:pimeloyl-ACP methyl ester carboxylesterase